MYTLTLPADGLPNVKNLLAITSIGLSIFPMLFCCYKSKQRCSSTNESTVKCTDSHTTVKSISTPEGIHPSLSVVKQDNSQHTYEDIDGDLIITQARTKELNSKLGVVKSAKDNELPELPNREYLNDIDFVVQEFDLILTRPPELPERTDDSSSYPMMADNASDNKMLFNHDTTKSDCKPFHQTLSHQRGNSKLKKVVITSVHPNVYNLTQPKAHVNQPHIQPTSKLQTLGQQSVKTEQMPHKSPPVNAYHTPGRVPCKVPLQSAPLPHQQPINSSRTKPSKAPLNNRQLPYRKPPNSEHMLSQPVPSTKDGQKFEGCSEYQNITARKPQLPRTAMSHQDVTVEQQQLSQDEITYQNTSAVQETYQNISAVQQPLPEDETNTYQSLLLDHGEEDEDEYMDMDTVAYY